MDFKIILDQLPQDVSTWLSSLSQSEVVGIFSNAYGLLTDVKKSFDNFR